MTDERYDQALADVHGGVPLTHTYNPGPSTPEPERPAPTYAIAHPGVPKVGDAVQVYKLGPAERQPTRHRNLRIPRSLDAQRCPRCGETRPFTRYDVCAPCTAAEGWDPPCPACHAEAADYRVTRAEHVPTCAGQPLTTTEGAHR